ncbi:hypothetical protein [Planctomicrobium sp. SH664]|uniref:hypothetical protein n=1 Tax=Planctomicrobium sp. SH664 TaxID=3448125 RepID=UPI003F5BA595
MAIDFPQGWDVRKFTAYSERLQGILQDLVDHVDTWVNSKDISWDYDKISEWMVELCDSFTEELQRLHKSSLALKQFIVCNAGGLPSEEYEFVVQYPGWAGGPQAYYACTLHGLVSEVADIWISQVRYFFRKVHSSESGKDHLSMVDDDGMVITEITGELPDILSAEEKALDQLGSTMLRYSVRIERERLMVLGAIGEQMQPPEPFIPSKMQEKMLSLLDGKAMTGVMLAERLGLKNRTEIYSRGLSELRSRGLVQNGKRGVGYYRPDRLPPF